MRVLVENEEIAARFNRQADRDNIIQLTAINLWDKEDVNSVLKTVENRLQVIQAFINQTI